MLHLENDAESGADVYQLHDDVRPTDDIYGEQPYGSEQGNRILLRHFPDDDNIGGLSILDLEDGSVYPIFVGTARFPAFHAWGKYVYYQEEIGSRLLLKRCHYQTLATEEIMALPAELGRFSYGTTSPDNRYYAVSVHREDKSCLVLLIDLADGSQRILAESNDQYFKHEQFSLDGSNRVLIQANASDVSVVNLGWMAVDGEGIDWLAVDAPPLAPCGRWPGGERHTPRCTGHEAWIGQTDRVFLSTRYDEEAGTNLFAVGCGDTAPTVVCKTPLRFGHVSVSRCGRFWVADAIQEEGIPIYLGTFESDACRRLVVSHTVHDGQQWSHTHPYLTSDNRWLIYNSTRAGRPQVHGAKIPPALLDELLAQSD